MIARDKPSLQPERALSGKSVAFFNLVDKVLQGVSFEADEGLRHFGELLVKRMPGCVDDLVTKVGHSTRQMLIIKPLFDLQNIAAQFVLFLGPRLRLFQ